MHVVEPLSFHLMMDVLNFHKKVVCSRTSKQLDTKSWYRTHTASSKSELVTYPFGLSQDLRFLTMSSGKISCHMMGCTADGYMEGRADLGC